MEEKINNVEKVIQYWKASSDMNYHTMHNLLKTRDYNWSLLLGHLVLEKLLKAHHVKCTQWHAIFTHDLLRLATKTGLSLTEETKEWLDAISTFNLNVRYDNYQQDFYKLCTKEFTDNWIKRIKKYLSLIPDEFGLKEAYLFGSFAKGDQRADSDIDIALVLTNMTDFFTIQNQLRKLRRQIDLRIEPHPIRAEDFNSSNPFAYEIAKTGVAIKTGKTELSY